jgi:hypothetical protein
VIWSCVPRVGGATTTTGPSVAVEGGAVEGGMVDGEVVDDSVEEGRSVVGISVVEDPAGSSASTGTLVTRTDIRATANTPNFEGTAER